MAIFGDRQSRPLSFAIPQSRGGVGGDSRLSVKFVSPLTTISQDKYREGAKRGGKLERRDVFRRQETVLTMIVHSSREVAKDRQ